MSGFLPPVVMKIMADGHQFITETGKVSAAMDAAAANAKLTAEKLATEARVAADAATAAAEKQVAAAETASKAAELAATKTVEAQKTATVAAQKAATAQATAAAEGTEAAQLAADKAVATASRTAAAAELSATRQAEAAGRAALAAEAAAAKQEAASAAIIAADERAAAAAEVTATRTGGAHAKIARSMAIGGGILAAGLATVAVKGLEAAGEYEKETTLLQTAGGELASNMGLVRDGILSVSSATGTSTDELAKGMFTVEKAGFRGAAGLNVLKVAAEGAKAENADMGTVTNALTSIMSSYHMKATDATSATNMLVAGSGAAKTSMQDYAGALSTVLPVASAAGISFPQVAGAIATLTQHGTSAAESTQELANTIRNLQAPNNVASKAMQQLGLDVNDVSTHVGKRGLTGTIQLITDAIASKLGPGGTVMVDTMMKSSTATKDLQLMMGKMPKSLAESSKAFLDGNMSQAAYHKEVKGLGAAGAAQGGAFMTLAMKVKGYNDTIKAGGPAAKTAAAQLKAIMGGATGMNTALMLSSVTTKKGGENMAMFKNKVKEVGDAGKKSGSDISTWSKTQQTLSVQMDKTKASFHAASITIGQQLAPAAKAVMGAFQGLFGFFAQHKTIATVLAVGLGILAGGLLIAAAAVWVMNSALLANPITWIIVGIVALIAVIVLLAANWSTVAAWITQVWGGFMNWIGEVIGGFINWWNQVWGGWANWIGELWGGMCAGITNLFNGFIGWINGAVSGFVGWWNGAWSNVGSTFAAIWSGLVNGAIQTGANLLNFFRDLPGNVLSFLSGLGSQMLSVGQNIVQGLIDGASGMVDKAVQAIKDIGGAMLKGVQNFLGIKSPSREFMKIGNWVTLGLAKGVTDKGAHAVAAVRSVAQRLTDAASAHFKKAGDLGAQITPSFASSKTAEGRAAAAYKALHNAALSGQARIEMAEGAALDRAAAMVEAQINRLGSLATRKAALAVKLKDAQKRLAAAVSVRDKEAADTTKNLRGEFKLGDMVGFSAAEMVSSTKAVASRILAFGAKIKQLRGLGVNASLISEVAGLGSQDGSTVADSLIAGGKGQIAQLNAAYGSIQSSTAAAGNAVADGMYGAGVNSLKSLASGLTKDMSAIDRAASTIASRLTAGVKADLGIKAPAVHHAAKAVAAHRPAPVHHTAPHHKAAASSHPLGLQFRPDGSLLNPPTKTVTNNVVIHAKNASAQQVGALLGKQLHAMS